MLERKSRDIRNVEIFIPCSRVCKRFTCSHDRSSSDRSDGGIADWSRTVALEDAEDLVTYSHGDVSAH